MEELIARLVADGIRRGSGPRIIVGRLRLTVLSVQQGCAAVFGEIASPQLLEQGPDEVTRRFEDRRNTRWESQPPRQYWDCAP